MNIIKAVIDSDSCKFARALHKASRAAHKLAKSPNNMALTADFLEKRTKLKRLRQGSLFFSPMADAVSDI